MTTLNEDLFNIHYPASQYMVENPEGSWQIGMAGILSIHLEFSLKGCKDSKERLINRIGQLNRNTKLKTLSPKLKENISKTLRYLLNEGHSINLAHEDPRFWISEKENKPRW